MARSRSSGRACAVSAMPGTCGWVRRTERDQAEAVHIRHRQVGDQHVRAGGGERRQRRRAPVASTTCPPRCSMSVRAGAAHRPGHPPPARARRRAGPPPSGQPVIRRHWRVPAVAVASGTRTVTVVPWPSPSLLAAIVPPCRSTMCRATARPSPSPPWRRVDRLSPWRKRSKTCGRNLRRCRAPESRTCTVRSCRVGRTRRPRCGRHRV